MRRIVRKLYLISADTMIITIAFLLALFIHYEGSISSTILQEYGQLVVIIIIAKLLIFYKFALYDSLWEYASIEELIKVVGAVIVGNIVMILYMGLMKFNVYLGIHLTSCIFEIVLIGGIRFHYRFLRRIRNRRPLLKQFYGKAVANVLIVGSGSAASLIATEIKNHRDVYGHVVGFIDDDRNKYGKVIAGVKVLGNRYDIYSVSKRYNVNQIILVVPPVFKENLKEILEECKRSDAKIKILPGIAAIIDGKISMNKIRDVEIEDLLGRKPVNLNIQEIATYLEDKSILVTGGGGSIGSELCRQIAKYNPRKLIILDIYENNAYNIQQELMRRYHDHFELEVLIASVRDRDSIHSIVKERRPEVIFHAAAHKHVPLMEHSPQEAIKNNVFGTMNIAEAADLYGVERFLLISTDKAVNPTNVMGASKRICEMIIQGLSKISKTKFSAVRFGNVLGSNGSVIPLFKRQIEEGGPVTVTHKDIMRYFMTIPEATQLVLQADAIARGGEVFVLDMGEPVKIYDLAVDLIKLSGLIPHKDIKIELTGLRPGEKLYEELLLAEEGLEDTGYQKIFIGNPSEIDYSLLKKSIKEFNKVISKHDTNELIEMIKHLVPSYVILSEKKNQEVDKQDDKLKNIKYAK